MAKEKNMSAENSIDLYRTEPGSLAGRYLRSFWQPVYRAKDLPAGEAVPLRIISEDFTLYGSRPASSAARAANLMWSHFAARTGGRSFRRAGWKTIASAVFITAGNMIRQGSASSSPARMRRSNRRSRFAAIPPKCTWGSSSRFSAMARRRRCRAIRSSMLAASDCVARQAPGKSYPYYSPRTCLK